MTTPTFVRVLLDAGLLPANDPVPGLLLEPVAEWRLVHVDPRCAVANANATTVHESLTGNELLARSARDLHVCGCLTRHLASQHGSVIHTLETLLRPREYDDVHVLVDAQRLLDVYDDTRTPAPLRAAAHAPLSRVRAQVKAGRAGPEMRQELACALLRLARRWDATWPPDGLRDLPAPVVPDWETDVDRSLDPERTIAALGDPTVFCYPHPLWQFGPFALESRRLGESRVMRIPALLTAAPKGPDTVVFAGDHTLDEAHEAWSMAASEELVPGLLAALRATR